MKNKTLTIITIINSVLIIALWGFIGIPMLSQSVSTQIQESVKEKNKDNKPSELVGLWVATDSSQKGYLISNDKMIGGFYINNELSSGGFIEHDWYVYNEKDTNYLVEVDEGGDEFQHTYELNNNILTLKLYGSNSEIIFEKVDN